MSAEDPLPELEEVIAASESGELPVEAGEWAAGAYETAESILDTVDSMQSDGIHAPTDAQSRALRNVHEAACRWLGRG
jgi:hypothetical protein